MIVGQTIQKIGCEIGLGQNQRRFNAKQLEYIFISVSYLCTLFIFLFHVANTPKEYTDGFYITETSVLIFIAYSSTIFQAAKIYDFIGDIEKILDKRKSVRLNLHLHCQT